MAHAALSLWFNRLLARFQACQRGPRRKRRLPSRALLLELLEQRDCPTTLTQPFTPTDVVVVTGNTMNEYTPSGSLVQSFPVVYPGVLPPTDEARGVVVDPSGVALVLNGNSSPYLSAVDPATQTWAHVTASGWSLADVPGYGEIGLNQQYAFAPNMSTPDAGIVRFDFTGAGTAFATSTAYNNVTIGLDGLLYAVRASTSVVDVYDPNSMSLLRSVTLAGASGAPVDPRGVAVDAAGNIFEADWTGVIVEFDDAGNILNSLNPNDGNLTSIALAANGQVVAGTSLGDVIVTNEALPGPTIFATNELGTEAYVALVPQTTAVGISSDNNTTFTAGSAGTFTVQSNGSPTPALSETGALPSGVTFIDNGDGTATLAGTPAAGTGGVYVFTIAAQSLAGGDATQTFTLTVNEAPSITSDPATAFSLGAAGTFTVTTGNDFPTATTLTETGNLPSGVTFTDNGDGTATLAGTPNPGTLGTYPVTITADNGDGNDAVQNFTLSVLKKSVTTLTVAPTAPVYGRALTLTATALPATGLTSLSGTVTFFDGTTPIGSAVAMVGRKATLTTTAIGAGSHSFTAVYSGDSAYGPSTSPAVVKSVATASTQVYLTPSTTAPVDGQPVTLTAHVIPVFPSTVTPTGTISFMDGTNVLATVTTTNGVAILSGETLAVGTHALTAVFASDNANDNGSTSVVHNITIGHARATIALTAGPSPAVVGQTVTLTANVTVAAPGSADPSGTVTFKDGLTTLGTVSITDGVATLSTASLAPGTHTLFAYYGGDGNSTATYSLARLAVDRASTTVDLSSSPTSGLAGKPFTLTANVGVVAPGVAVPSGTVAFYHGSTLLGTGIVNNGVASFTAPKLAAGTYIFTAVYRGSAQCLDSSTHWTVTISQVGQGSTTVAVSSPASPSTVGTPVTFTATVDAVSPTDTPTGSVTFYDGTNLLGIAFLSNGSATWSAVNLSSGTHSITAAYSGDGNFAPNTSAAWTQVVQVGTTTALTVSSLAAVVGQPLTLTARVSPTSFSTFTPTGTITFMDGTNVLGTGSLTNGVATLANQTLAAGPNALTAVFASGSNLDANSTSSVVNATIAKAQTAVTFSATPSPAVYGQTVTLTANVNVLAPGAC